MTKTLRSKRQFTNAFTMANLLYQPGKRCTCVTNEIAKIVNIINKKLAPNWQKLAPLKYQFRKYSRPENLTT